MLFFPLSFCLFTFCFFFTEHKLLQLLKSQGFLFWLDFCWVWLNIGASLHHLSHNQIYAAISFFCLPVSEPFGLSLILSRFMFCCAFCPSLSHNDFSTDIPLHHQTSNEGFCYIQLMTGENRDRKALKMLGTTRSSFTQQQVMVEQTVSRKMHRYRMTVNGPLQQGLRFSTDLMLTQDSSGNRGMKQRRVFLKGLATDGSHFVSRLPPVDTPERHQFSCRRRVATGLRPRALHPYN